MLSRFIKNVKQLKENYRPISLLPICGKILERLIYNKMFDFFTDNKSMSSNQWIQTRGLLHQSIVMFTHYIYQSFDDGPKIRAVFLGKSKAFIKFGIRVYSIN